MDLAEDNGDATGVAELGSMYFAGTEFRGTKIPKNKKKARQLWEKGVELKDPACQFDLGQLYFTGDGGVKMNKARAHELWSAAAAAKTENGHAENDARFYLGMMYSGGLLDPPYSGGDGVDQDWAKVTMHWEGAADNGDTRSQEHLGDLYGSGDGRVPKDYKKALKYRSKAAKKSKEAKFKLAAMHYNGQGTPVDKGKALKMWNKLAEAGDRDAAYNAGIMYAEGDGVGQDGLEAMRLFDFAATKGKVEAYTKMGLLWYEGIGGIKQNKTMAINAFRLASSKGDGQATHIMEKDEVMKDFVQMASEKFAGNGEDVYETMVKKLLKGEL